MKKVIKVSISRIPFTMEEDAYEVFNNYLKQLSLYYKGQENGEEVVDGIEERAAELLAEQSRNGEDVVNLNMVQQAIKVLGSPEIIEDTTTSGEIRGGRPVKRLHRDLSNCVIGGVCSGMGALWNIDPIIVRLAFVILFCSGIFTHWEGTLVFATLLYLLLWMIVPAARTVEQKCAMRGEPLSARNIQDQVNSRQSYVVEERRGGEFWRVFGRIIAICVGVFFIIITIPVLFAITVGITIGGAALSWTTLLPFADIISLGSASLLIKIFATAVVVLPFIGLVYLACKLIFNLHMRIHLGLIIFLLWLASLIGLTVVVCTNVDVLKFNESETVTENKVIDTQSDTLYLHLESTGVMEKKNMFYNADESELNLIYINKGRVQPKVVAFPSIDIIHRSADTPFEIRMEGKAFGRNDIIAREDAQSNIPMTEVRDSLLVVKAYEYSKHRPWDGAYGKIKIYVPDGKKVIMDQPFEHRFDRDTDDDLDFDLDF